MTSIDPDLVAEDIVGHRPARRGVGRHPHRPRRVRRERAVALRRVRRSRPHRSSQFVASDSRWSAWSSPPTTSCPSSSTLFEVNEAAQLAALVVFDEDDLDGALDELDERFIAGEGSDHEYLIRRGTGLPPLAGPARRCRALALLDPAIEIVDHRPLGLGTFGLDGERCPASSSAPSRSLRTSPSSGTSVHGDATLGHLDVAQAIGTSPEPRFPLRDVSRLPLGRRASPVDRPVTPR